MRWSLVLFGALPLAMAGGAVVFVAPIPMNAFLCVACYVASIITVAAAYRWKPALDPSLDELYRYSAPDHDVDAFVARARRKG